MTTCSRCISSLTFLIINLPVERGEDDQCEYAVVKFEDGTTAQLEHAKLKQRVVAVSMRSRAVTMMRKY
jgi:hypothetical protein